MRRVMVVSSWCSSNGSGGSGLGPHRRRSSWYEESDWCSASDRIFTTSRRAGASRNPVRAPVREDGRARMVSGSCFRARAGSAAFWFSACPAGTGRILAPCHSAGHSCTVLSVRSTIFAMMLVLTPSEAYRIASVFIPASTRLPGPLPPPDQDGGLLPGRPRPARPHRIRNGTGNPRNTVPSHAGHSQSRDCREFRMGFSVQKIKVLSNLPSFNIHIFNIPIYYPVHLCKKPF